ncbi:MAG: TlpA family protein disulfide reductase [Polyangiales bacterium]
MSSPWRAAVVAFACALGACDAPSGDSAAPAPSSRVEAVAPKAITADPLSGFCDAHADSGNGRAFHFPPVEGTAPSVGGGGLLWVNLWATWCKPCVEEMPMIAGWKKDLATKGKNIDLRFVSVDEDAKAVDAFRAQHPGMPDTMRLASPSALAPYIAELGLDSGAGLPIHVFVDKTAHVRCVRAGAVADSHLAIIASMLN